MVKKNTTYVYIKYFRKNFTNRQEKDIWNEILKLINEGNIITTLYIARIALFYYYSPENIADRYILIQNLKKKIDSKNCFHLYFED